MFHRPQTYQPTNSPEPSRPQSRYQTKTTTRIPQTTQANAALHLSPPPPQNPANAAASAPNPTMTRNPATDARPRNPQNTNPANPATATTSANAAGAFSAHYWELCRRARTRPRHAAARISSVDNTISSRCSMRSLTSRGGRERTRLWSSGGKRGWFMSGNR